MGLHLLREHVEQVQSRHWRHRARRRREHRAGVDWKRLAVGNCRLRKGKMLRGDACTLVELHCLVRLLFAEAHDRRDVRSVDVFAPASGEMLGDLVECHFGTKERDQMYRINRLVLLKETSASYQLLDKTFFFFGKNKF